MKFSTFFLVVSSLFCLQCNQATIMAGGSTTTDNAKISGKALYEGGRPAKGAAVRIRPSEYVRPIGPEPDSITRHDTTVNDSGCFFIDSLDTGVYHIEINNQKSDALLLTGTIATTRDSVDLPPDTLRPYCIIEGKVDSLQLGKGPLFAQIYGLNRLAPIDSITGVYNIPDLPRGTYTLRIVSTDSSVIPVRIDSVKSTATTEPAPVVPSGQWLPTNGPNGGTVTGFAVLGTDVFAATQGGGVFRLDASGAAWRAVNSGLLRLDIKAIAAQGGDLFAGTYGSGVFRSSDKGANWKGVNTGFNSFFIVSFAVHGGDIVAGTDDGSVFLSTDRGDNWKEADSGLRHPVAIPALTPDTAVNALVSKDSLLFAGTDGKGVFYSSNKGARWSPVNNGLTNLKIQALVASDTELFAGTRGSGVFRSVDNGATWTPATAGVDPLINALAVSGKNLLAGTDNGAFLSSDNGTSWSAISTGMNGRYVHAFAMAGATIFAGLEHDGAYVSANSGATWTQINTGLVNSDVNALAMKGSLLFAGLNNALGGGVARSSDNGVTWTACGSLISDKSWNVTVSAILIIGNDVLAGTIGNGAFRSPDDGATWAPVTNGLDDLWINCFAKSGTTLFAGGSNGIYRSTDNGTTWKAVNNGVSTSTMITALVVIDTTIFAGTNGSGVLVSSDNGSSWMPQNSGLPDLYILSLSSSGTVVLAGNSDGVYKSVDRGASWTASNSGIGQNPIISLAADGSNVLAGTWNNGAFLSTDNGVTWKPTSPVLFDTQTRCFAFSKNFLFVGTSDNGVLRMLMK